MRVPGGVGAPHSSVPSVQRARGFAARLRLAAASPVSTLAIAGVVATVVTVGRWTGTIPHMGDGFTYWSVDALNPYTNAVVGHGGAFYYSPPFALAMGVVHLVPWPVVEALWTLAMALMLATMMGIWSLVVLPIPFIGGEIINGNITMALGFATFLAIRRYPALWAVVLLTKSSSGVGCLWYVARREWRPLLVIGALVASVACVSAIVRPQSWPEWFDALAVNAAAPIFPTAIQVPLAVRLPVAALLVLVAGRLNAAWIVPLASTLALPVLWPSGLAAAIAAFPLATGRPGQRADAARVAARRIRIPVSSIGSIRIAGLARHPVPVRGQAPDGPLPRRD